MISFDNYINETTTHADVILPGPSPLEQAHWDVWAWPWCLTSGGHYSAPLFAQQRMEEWRVVMYVTEILAGRCFEEIDTGALRSEEHTSELQSLMRISYAVFCLKKKKNRKK